MRLALLALLVAVDGARASTPDVLRVCADPDGFERQIAAVLADELGMRLEVTPGRRHGIVRDLAARRCDAVLGVPVGFGGARTTAPYYRSSYALVSRADRGLDVHSLADPRLAKLTIGVEQADATSALPAPALSERGLHDVVGHPDVLRSIVDGDLDLAVVWGPRARVFASCVAAKLVVTPIDEAEDSAPVAFDIAIGVRRTDAALAAKLDRALDARRDEIVRILDAWEVPRHRGSPMP